MAKAKATDTVTNGEEAPKRKRGRPKKERPIDPETGLPIENKKVVRHPLPDGWDLPGEFFAYISFYEISDASQQAIYAWTRGAEEHTVKVKDKEGNETEKVVEANGFPCKKHTDDRVIINRAEAIEWIKAHEEAKRNRVTAARSRELNASTRMIASVCRITNLLYAAASANANANSVQANS